jgi:hypothetical protein
VADTRINVILGAKDEASKVVKGLRGQFETFKRDALTGFGLGAGINVFNLATQALGGVVDLMGDAIAAASDLAESQSKVDQVFTDSAQVIHDWAEGAAEGMGLAKQTALEAAGTFGNFIQALGNTEDEANRMSRTLVGLAADLASFNNQDIDEVLVSLRSGLAGEAEPMRRLGVSISAARVESNILAKGIARTRDEITDAMKVAERYAIIMEDTSKAQGDFARTSDGLANKTRIVTAQMQDLSADIGERLLPYQLAWNDAILNTLKLLDRMSGNYEKGSVEDIIWGEADATKAYIALTEKLGISQDELGWRLVALGHEHKSYRQAMEAVNEVGEDALRRTVAQIKADEDLAARSKAMAHRYRLLNEELEASIALRKKVGASDALREQALQEVATLKELRQQARAAHDAIAVLFKGPEEAARSTRALRVEDERLHRQRDRAFRKGRVAALIAIDTRRAEIEALLETRRKQRNYFNQERREWRALKRGAKETTDSQQDEQSDLQDELGRTEDRMEDIRRLAQLPVEFQVNVDASEVDSTLAKIQQLRAVAGGTAPYPGGWDGDVSAPYPRALGGPVSRGETYIVGERGPELLHMGAQSGHVTPNHAIGGGHSHVIVMDGRVVGQLIDERLGRRAAVSARSGSYRS